MIGIEGGWQEDTSLVWSAEAFRSTGADAPTGPGAVIQRVSSSISDIPLLPVDQAPFPQVDISYDATGYVAGLRVWIESTDNDPNDPPRAAYLTGGRADITVTAQTIPAGETAFKAVATQTFTMGESAEGEAGYVDLRTAPVAVVPARGSKLYLPDATARRLRVRFQPQDPELYGPLTFSEVGPYRLWVEALFSR